MMTEKQAQELAEFEVFCQFHQTLERHRLVTATSQILQFVYTKTLEGKTSSLEELHALGIDPFLTAFIVGALTQKQILNYHFQEQKLSCATKGLLDFEKFCRNVPVSDTIFNA